MKLLRLPEPSIKASDLARVWGCSSRWVRRLVSDGELEGAKMGRDWVVPVRAANDFFEKRRVRHE